MKRLIIGLVSILGMVWAASAIAAPDMKEATVKVKLVVYELTELTVSQPADVIPTAEDYSRRFGSGLYDVTAGSAAPLPDYGFASVHDAMQVSMFTNAKSGATVHVVGSPNPDLANSLQNADVYLTVQREKTFVLQAEPGATPLAATAKSVPKTGVQTLDKSWANACTTVDDTGQARFLQLNSEAREFFGVQEATKAVRLWVVQLGVANLAEYTSNLAGYTMDLTYILMPVVA